jgi:uncharacterized protein YaaW (UPF0174 family)
VPAFEAGLSGDDALAAILFLSAINETMQAYGTLNSSPWTAESFGADDRRAAALKEYVAHAVIFSMATAGIAAVVARGRKATWSILGGAALVNIYLVWLYMRASQRGRAAGADSWASG